MDERRRKVLHKVLDALAELKEQTMDKKTAMSILNDALDKVEKCMDEEDACIDARPENLMWSTVTINMQDNLADLTNAYGDLECAAEDCKKMDSFNYATIQRDICDVVHSINSAIYRR